MRGTRIKTPSVYLKSLFYLSELDRHAQTFGAKKLSGEPLKKIFYEAELEYVIDLAYKNYYYEVIGNENN